MPQWDNSPSTTECLELLGEGNLDNCNQGTHWLGRDPVKDT